MEKPNENKTRLKLFIPAILFIIGIGTLLLALNISKISFLSNIYASTPRVVFILILLSIILFLYFIFNYIAQYYQKKYTENSPFVLSIFTLINRIIGTSFLIAAINIIIFSVPMPASYQSLLSKTVSGLLIFLVTFFIIKIIRLIEPWYRHHVTVTNSCSSRQMQSNLTKIKIISQTAIFVVVVLSIAMMLMLFENVRTVGISLLASAGFITAIVGFAAQKPLSALFTSFNLAFSQPIKIDDKVFINNEMGTIEEINLNYVIVRVWDLRRLVIPINYFMEQTFQNWSYNTTHQLGTVFIYVDFMTPIKALRDKLFEFLNETTLWDKSNANLQVSNFKEHCIEVRITIGAKTDDLWNLQVFLREKFIEFFQDNPTYLPYQREIHFPAINQKQTD